MDFTKSSHSTWTIFSGGGQFTITLPEYDFEEPFFPRYYAVIRPMQGRLVAVLGLFAFGIILGLWKYPIAAWGFGGGLILYVTLWVKGYFKSKQATEHIFRNILKGEGTLNVDSTGIECIRNENRSFFEWESVSSVVETREYFTLFTGKTPFILVEDELLTTEQKQYIRTMMELTKQET